MNKSHIGVFLAAASRISLQKDDTPDVTEGFKKKIPGKVKCRLAKVLN